MLKQLFVSVQKVPFLGRYYQAKQMEATCGLV